MDCAKYHQFDQGLHRHHSRPNLDIAKTKDNFWLDYYESHCSCSIQTSQIDVTLIICALILANFSLAASIVSLERCHMGYIAMLPRLLYTKYLSDEFPLVTALISTWRSISLDHE